jgi:hypothetical protein
MSQEKQLERELVDHDIFICHASEDKDQFVRPLAQLLKERGVRVWYDEFSLHAGDSLRESIDCGLVASNYGVVVLSEAFFQKRWPQQELNGLVAREMAEQRRLLIPVWLNIDQRIILNYSPTLADLLAVKYAGNMQETVETIVQTLRLDDPYTLISGRQTVKIYDRQGLHAEWLVERTFRVNRIPLKSLEMRITADGKVTPLHTNRGTIKYPITEGGLKTLVIEFSDPIPVGEVVTHIISFDERDTFRYKDAEVNVTPILPYPYYEICVELPEPNLPSEITAYKRVRARKVPIPGLEVNADRTRLVLRIIRPEVGFSYFLAWVWDVDETSDQQQSVSQWNTGGGISSP